MNYIEGVYKRKVQAEIDSYRVSDNEDKRDTIQTQDVLVLEKNLNLVTIYFYINFLAFNL